MAGVELITMRRWLLEQVMIASPETTIFEALEAISSTAIEHPEWDLDAKKPREEWDEA